MRQKERAEPAQQLSGRPATVWQHIAESPGTGLVRAREVPRPESVQEVAKWEDPDGLGKVELHYAPAFWALLPLTALGYLAWGTVTHPGGHDWVGTVFGETVHGPPWSHWFVWAIVGIWLLIALGVLALRTNLASEVRKDNQWIFEHGTAHTIHRSPFTHDGGEGFTSPTFIAIDHRIDDAQAARIHQALYTWLSDGTVQEQLSRRTLRRPQGVIAAQDIFGPEATGGYYVESVPGFGSADDFEAHRWALVTEPRDERSEPNVTTVPCGKKLRRIRSKLRRRAARRSGQ
ncbi:hypothetical protein OG923_12005 [Streptomyces halstedii]|uniref:hypothetical protein n=1 Tax=Streptomyces halstedii TaxID=1944 RepID=UPI003246A4E9